MVLHFMRQSMAATSSDHIGKVSRMCYTILFKHIPSKKACSFPKNMSGI
jgi:hypothetical protein